MKELKEFIVVPPYMIAGSIYDRCPVGSLCDRCPVKKWCKVKIAAAKDGYALRDEVPNYEECVNFATATKSKEEKLVAVKP